MKSIHATRTQTTYFDHCAYTHDYTTFHTPVCTPAISLFTPMPVPIFVPQFVPHFHTPVHTHFFIPLQYPFFSYPCNTHVCASFSYTHVCISFSYPCLPMVLLLLLTSQLGPSTMVVPHILILIKLKSRFITILVSETTRRGILYM